MPTNFSQEHTSWPDLGYIGEKRIVSGVTHTDLVLNVASDLPCIDARHSPLVIQCGIQDHRVSATQTLPVTGAPNLGAKHNRAHRFASVLLG